MFESLADLSPWLVIILVGLARVRSIARVLIYALAALVVIMSRNPMRVDQAKYVLAVSTDTSCRSGERGARPQATRKTGPDDAMSARTTQ